MTVINNLSEGSPLIGQKVFYSYTQELIHDHGNATYTEKIEHEKTGIVNAVGTDAEGKFHILIMDVNSGALESFPIDKMEVIKVIKKPLPAEEIPREELIDLE